MPFECQITEQKFGKQLHKHALIKASVARTCPIRGLYLQLKGKPNKVG